MLGQIVVWGARSRFGWIASEVMRTRGIFLHRDGIVSGEPALGRWVRFECRDNGRGPRAEQAHILGEEKPDEPGESFEPAYRVPEIDAYFERRDRR